MHAHYADILSRIPEPPTWWDENAVPRWCEFHPDEVANIYATEVALVLIRCQACQTPFKVAFSSSSSWVMLGREKHLSEILTDLHYGDPPNNRCCAAGPTMNSEPVRVMQFWSKRNDAREWQRLRDHEIPLDGEE